MPKSFSEQEKNRIRESLIEGCKENWKKYGYKRTGIDGLCEKAGISKGAFYIFFQSKEHLFCETLKEVQQSLYALVEEILLEEQSVGGLAKALKAVYAEYDKIPFLFNMTGPDFTSFINKLSDEEKQTIILGGYSGAKQMLDKPFLKLRIDEEKAFAILSSLLSIIEMKEKLPYNHIEVFEFMLDNLIDKIFE